MDQSLIDNLLTFSEGRRVYNDIDFSVDKYYCNSTAPLKVEGIYSFDEEKLCHEIINITCNIPNCFEVFDNVLEYESHYNSKHKYNCSACKKLLPSNHLLDLHICETHDSFFAVLSEKKASFSCYIETCSLKFWNTAERRKHCIDHHQFPPNFRFDKLKIKNKKEETSRNRSDYSNLKMIVDQCLLEQAKPLENNDMIVDAIADNTKRTKNKKPKKQQQSEDAVMCEDDTAIIQEKIKIKSFTFGHFKNKGFAKTLTKMGENVGTCKNVLEDENMMSDLAESLPK